MKLVSVVGICIGVLILYSVVSAQESQFEQADSFLLSRDSEIRENVEDYWVSSDNSWLVYRRRNPFEVEEYYFSKDITEDNLATTDANFLRERGGFEFLGFSANNRAALLERSANGRLTIKSVSLTGEGETTIVDFEIPQRHDVERVKITADSQFILFNEIKEGEDDADSFYRIYSVPTSGGTPQPITDYIEFSEDGEFDQFEITPNGRFVVYRSRYNLWALSVGGGTPVRLSEDGNSINDFQISSDSERVAYTQFVLGIDKGLFSVKLDGTQRTKLNTEQGETCGPGFFDISSNGQTVFYEAFGCYESYAAPIAGGQAVDLTPNGFGTQIEQSGTTADNSIIAALLSNDGLFKFLYTMGPDGSNPNLRGLENTDSISRFYFTADGQYIMYSGTTKFTNGCQYNCPFFVKDSPQGGNIEDFAPRLERIDDVITSPVGSEVVLFARENVSVSAVDPIVLYHVSVTSNVITQISALDAFSSESLRPYSRNYYVRYRDETNGRQLFYIADNEGDGVFNLYLATLNSEGPKQTPTASAPPISTPSPVPPSSTPTFSDTSTPTPPAVPATSAPTSNATSVPPTATLALLTSTPTPTDKATSAAPPTTTFVPSTSVPSPNNTATPTASLPITPTTAPSERDVYLPLVESP